MRYSQLIEISGGHERRFVYQYSNPVTVTPSGKSYETNVDLRASAYLCRHSDQ